jgi:hypothetical protein
MRVRQNDARQQRRVVIGERRRRRKPPIAIATVGKVGLGEIRTGQTDVIVDNVQLHMMNAGQLVPARRQKALGEARRVNVVMQIEIGAKTAHVCQQRPHLLDCGGQGGRVAPRGAQQVKKQRDLQIWTRAFRLANRID